MQRPSWAPVVFSGAVPREFSDLLAVTILLIATTQAVLSQPVAFASLGPEWILLLLVPVTCALASLSNSAQKEREELALFAYGGSPRQISMRYAIRGCLVAAIGTLPLFFRFLTSGFSYSADLVILVTLVFIGGSSYAASAVRRIRSANFVGHYKG
jgi:hypothetical protein